MAPWVWNRFTAGEDANPGAHLGEAMTMRRAAWLRAGFGEVSPAALATIAWLGCLGVGWLIVEGIEWRTPGLEAAGRFGHGIRWSLPVAAALLAFAGTLHALQPMGPAKAATARQTFQVVGTAWVTPALVWLACGIFGFLGHAALGSAVVLALCGAVALLAGAAGVLATGYGMAVRRGANPFVGVASAMLAWLVAAGLFAVAAWIYVDPPWGNPW